MEINHKLKVIITGSTGMVGEGVLHVCLNDDRVENILVVNRRPCGYVHPKLKEIILSDFLDLSASENDLKGYDACFFCLGITSVRATEAQYTKVTYDLTLNFAGTLSKLNPDMTFIYVSGAGTTGNENARLMWVRVKSKTENALKRLPFGKEFNFRPGFMKTFKGAKNIQSIYKFIGWIFPIGRALSTGTFLTLDEVGTAMINACFIDDMRKDFEGKDILELSEKDNCHHDKQWQNITIRNSFNTKRFIVFAIIFYALILLTFAALFTIEERATSNDKWKLSLLRMLFHVESFPFYFLSYLIKSYSIYKLIFFMNSLFYAGILEVIIFFFKKKNMIVTNDSEE